MGALLVPCLAACGGTTTVDATVTCYASGGTFELDRGDGTVLQETGLTDGFPYTCTSFIDSSKHFGLVLTGAHVGDRVFRIEYLFTLANGGGSSFEVVPWSVSRAMTLNRFGAEFEELKMSDAAEGTAMVWVSEWTVPIAPDGVPTRQWTSSGGGTIQAAPATWWTGLDTAGTVRLNHAGLALATSGLAASAISSAGPSASILGLVTVAGSTAKFQCEGDGIQSGGASCVTFLGCDPKAPTLVCPPGCMTCGPAVGGVNRCCILDGNACPGDGTACCSGHCKNQICMTAKDAAEYDAKCSGGGGADAGTWCKPSTYYCGPTSPNPDHECCPGTSCVPNPGGSPSGYSCF